MLGLAAALVAACAAIAFTRPVGLDYGNLDCHLRLAYCDDAEPSLGALIHGDVAGFFHRQTLMGPASILLRAPFAALGGLHHYDTRLVYDLGSFACLLALGGAALLVAREMLRRGSPAWRVWLVGLGMIVNPLVFRALYFGHPEEAVATGFCIAGAVFAIRARPVATGALAGLAVTTKLWGILAVPALLLALPGRLRLRGVVALVVVVAVLYGPMAAVDPGRFRRAVTSANDLGTTPGTAQASNVWYFVANRVQYERLVAIANGRLIFQRENGFALSPGIGRVTHPIVVVLALLLALLWSRRPRAPGDPSVLLLLAVIFLARCILDPNNFSYYHVAFFGCLLAWEGLARRGVPFISIAAGALLQAQISLSPHIHSDAGFVWLYLGWALPFVAALAFVTLRPRSARPAG